MAHKKIPTNETLEQQKERQIKEDISKFSPRGEKTSWNRKLENMVKLLTQLRPIEDKIIDLQAQKIPIFDEVHNLREIMIKECIHPFDYLVVNEDHVICKFCNRRINISNNG